MRGVRSGRLKDRLVIQRGTRTRDDVGGFTTAWTEIANRKCEIRPLRSAEFFAGGAESVDAVYEIRFRYESSVFAHANRLVDTRVSPNRIFDIQTIVNTGNWDSEILVTAVERRWPSRG